MLVNVLLTSISVLTINVWGLPNFFIKKQALSKNERINQICKILKASSPDELGWDVIFLQEVWELSDRRKLADCGYSHTADLDYMDFDSGVMILSRYPIEEDSIERLEFSENGFFSRLFKDGEFLTHKSAIIAKIVHPKFGPIWFANTHLVSAYESEDIYISQRKKQFQKFVDWAQEKSGSEPLILGGDLNTGPGKKDWKDYIDKTSKFSQAEYSPAICTYEAETANMPCKLDHLFSSKHFESLSASLEHRFRNISDHLGWQTRFLLRTKPLEQKAILDIKPVHVDYNPVKNFYV
ncbi:MAG: endonuclease/exonuclease/phosphatase family protein [Bacteriovoracia bacterium]